MKPIVYVPHPVLTTPAKTVTRFDKKLSTLVAHMKETLVHATNPKGVGLAAPQIGEPWRVFLTRPTEKGNIRVFINPEIIAASKTLTDGVPDRKNPMEGCLSIPKIWGEVKRNTSLTLRFQDENGAYHEEKCTKFLATIIQHETDHTNGILFTQRVLEQKGKLYQVTVDKAGKEVLEHIEV